MCRVYNHDQGGVFMITSRILIVDLLNGTLDPVRVSGIIVNQAHRVTDISTEAFIVRIYRCASSSASWKHFIIILTTLLIRQSSMLVNTSTGRRIVMVSSKHSLTALKISALDIIR